MNFCKTIAIIILTSSTKRLLCLSTALAGSFLLSFPAMAQQSRVFENPILSGLWVDACVLEYGKANCSRWAQEQAATTFCRNKGYSRAVSASTRNEGSKHQTWRLKHSYVDGQKKVEYEICNKCGFRLVEVDCKSP